MHKSLLFSSAKCHTQRCLWIISAISCSSRYTALIISFA